MDRAINKKTDKLVHAFDVFKDGSYQNLIKGEWISPKDSIHNWDEIQEEDSFVHYVKEKRYTNWKGTDIVSRPHFAVYPGSKAKTVGETPEHKMLKNWMFNRLYKDDLEIIYSKATKKYKFDNINKLSELKIDWNNYSVEVPIRSRKNLQADILLPFKKKHELLGYGIVIEIQLSKQNKEQTYNRSIDRAINGYSTIWLFENDFEINEDEIELKSNKLKVFSFSSELKHSGKKFARELKILVENQCRYLDIKKEELIKKTEEIEDYKLEIIEELKKKINGFFGYKIKEISENFNEEIANKVQKDFFEKNEYKITKLINDGLKDYINEELFNNITNKLNLEDIKEEAKNLLKNKIENYKIYKEFISDPPRCGGCNSNLILDNGQYGLWLKCPNYPYCKAKNSHSIPNEIKVIFNDKD